MKEIITIQYQLAKTGQYTWSGKTDKCVFAATMANDLDELARFCRKQFPGREISLIPG